MNEQASSEQTLLDLDVLLRRLFLPEKLLEKRLKRIVAPIYRLGLYVGNNFVFCHL